MCTVVAGLVELQTMLIMRLSCRLRADEGCIDNLQGSGDVSGRVWEQSKRDLLLARSQVL